MLTLVKALNSSSYTLQGLNTPFLLVQLMSPASWSALVCKVCHHSSVAYLCDSVINEPCLYLCSSSNRRRWCASTILGALNGHRDKHFVSQPGKFIECSFDLRWWVKDSVTIMDIDHNDRSVSGHTFPQRGQWAPHCGFLQQLPLQLWPPY